MRYPTRGKKIISPYELGYHAPTFEEQTVKRLVTQHHGYFEKARYHDVRFRSVFRNLVTNVYPLLASDHTDLHIEYDAPIMPPDSLMIEVIEEHLSLNGFIECVREKKTKSTYRVEQPEWEHIKRGYCGQNRMAG